MRNKKNTRKCKGCWQEFEKTKEVIENREYLQIAYDKLEKKIIISDALNINGMRKNIIFMQKK